MSRQSVARISSRFFLASYVVLLAVGWGYAAEGTSGPARAFAFAALFAYCFVYLLPSLLCTQLVQLAVAWSARGGPIGRKRRAVLWSTAVVTTSATGILLHVDRTVHEIFGFHLNGFVWNLVTTPGGWESMESSPSAERAAFLRVVGIVALQCALLALCVRRQRRSSEGRPRWGRRLLAAGVLLFFAQTAVYSFCTLHGYTPVAVAATRFPGYYTLTIGRFAKRWGFFPEREEGVELASAPLTLRYPLAPLEVDPAGPTPNVVWLVIESLRADAMTPEIMPETCRLAEHASVFERHYSGGNGTRMGVFALFYGLYGTYWFSFVNERRPPVLLEVLEERGYWIEAWSSATFTYPEFDRTVFSGLPPEQLHPYERGTPKWESDRSLVRGLDAMLESRDESRPFAAFLFFDGTHARYHFPEESAIFEPYATEVDYTDLDLEQDVELLRNRYLNAVHEVDARVGEVVALLERRGIADDTILLVTGDHGQEFLEHGRWGHNSSFCDEQVLVPFVLRVPGRARERIQRMTSHLDVAPTFLRLLGVTQAPSDYSLGLDLFGAEERRFAVACDWSELAWIDGELKISLPHRGPALLHNQSTTADDEPLADPDAALDARRDELFTLLRDMARFGSAASAAQNDSPPPVR